MSDVLLCAGEPEAEVELAPALPWTNRPLSSDREFRAPFRRAQARGKLGRMGSKPPESKKRGRRRCAHARGELGELRDGGDESTALEMVG